MDIRLIVDEPARGSWNMAVDEVLLQKAGQGGGAVLRFYEWNEPTLSLGYFQKLGARSEHPASSELPVVRRATGGGAIVHHHELTYSFAAPIHNRFSPELQDCVKRFHESIIATFAEDGIRASLAGAPAKEKKSEPFLCFERRNALDIVIGESKVVGSAQRRHQRALLQHGSILLSRSPNATTLPGVVNLTGIGIEIQAFIRRWAVQLCDEFGFGLANSTLTDDELSLAFETEATRFAHLEWTRKR